MPSLTRSSDVSLKGRVATFGPVIGLCIATFALGSGVRAQNSLLKLADATAFREMFLDVPPPPSRGLLIGATIAGLRIDGPARDFGSDFDPKAVRVMLGDGDPTRQFLCVRFISRDGHYSALARYKLVPDAGPAPMLE